MVRNGTKTHRKSALCLDTGRTGGGFCVSMVPTGENADEIYDFCNAYLSENTVSPGMLLKKFNVEFACPCMAFCDDVKVLEKNTHVAPPLRCDDVLVPTRELLSKLENATNIKKNNLDDYKKALKIRLGEFSECGCIFSDVALDCGFAFCPDDGNNNDRLKKYWAAID